MVFRAPVMIADRPRGAVGMLRAGPIWGQVESGRHPRERLNFLNFTARSLTRDAVRRALFAV